MTKSQETAVLLNAIATELHDMEAGAIERVRALVSALAERHGVQIPANEHS